MTASRNLPNASAAEVYDGPPDYRQGGRHGVFPETSHDEIARLNFLAQMNRHLGTRVLPHVRTAWERRAGPTLERLGALGEDLMGRALAGLAPETLASLRQGLDRIRLNLKHELHPGV